MKTSILLFTSRNALKTFTQTEFFITHKNLFSTHLTEDMDFYLEHMCDDEGADCSIDATDEQLKEILTLDPTIKIAEDFEFESAHP